MYIVSIIIQLWCQATLKKEILSICSLFLYYILKKRQD